MKIHPSISSSNLVTVKNRRQSFNLSYFIENTKKILNSLIKCVIVNKIYRSVSDKAALNSFIVLTAQSCLFSETAILHMSLNILYTEIAFIWNSAH